MEEHNSKAKSASKFDGNTSEKHQTTQPTNHSKGKVSSMPHKASIWH